MDLIKDNGVLSLIKKWKIKFLISFNFLTTDQQYPIDFTFQNLKVQK